MSNDVVKITVTTLQSLYANSITSTLDGQLLVLEGFYFSKGGKLYGKYYYDEIVSKDKQNRITAQFTSDLKNQVKEGKYYQFEGFISKAQNLSNDSSLNVFFTLSRIITYEPKVQLISEVEYNILHLRFQRNFPSIDDTLINKIENGLTPILDIVTGIQSTSEDDYMSQLENPDFYRIRHHRCNLSSKNDILRFMASYDFTTTDLLIILRGGGTGLEVFNEIDLCKNAIELPVPFITGIGHDSDETLLERIADRGFSTPTAVGSFLQKTINTYKERTSLLKAKDKEFQNLKDQAEKNRIYLTTQMSYQKKTLTIVWIILLVFTAIIVFLILRILK